MSEPLNPPPPADPAPTFRLLAQCPPGLEPLLLGELREQGIRATAIQGGVRWTGGWGDLMRANLHLRTASRVLVELGSFRARALGELERKGADLPWDRVPRDRPARFRVSASRSRLYHEGAIEERLRRAAELPPPRTEDEADHEADHAASDAAHAQDDGPLVVVRVHRDEVTVRLDTSGEHLHRRGYRLHVGVAPLRETLAAALVLAGPGRAPRTVLDPFCGSGTVVIEAALAARNIAPGLAQAEREPRGYAFQGWPDAPADLWADVVHEARRAILPPPDPAAPPRFLGSDRDPRVLEAARSNAARAGVQGSTTWAEATLSRAPLPPEPSAWLLTNPPYGARLGERRRLRALYASLGRAFHPDGRFGASCSLLYLSGDPVLDAATGLPLEERFATSHGGLRVRAVAWTPESEPRREPEPEPEPETEPEPEPERDGAQEGGCEEAADPDPSAAPRSGGPDAPEA